MGPSELTRSQSRTALDSPRCFPQLMVLALLVACLGHSLSYARPVAVLCSPKKFRNPEDVGSSCGSWMRGSVVG